MCENETVVHFNHGLIPVLLFQPKATVKCSRENSTRETISYLPNKASHQQIFILKIPLRRLIKHTELYTHALF